MTKREKTGGRSKGTPNKVTAEVREHFSTLVSENMVKLQSDIDSLEPLQRVKVILDMAKFVLPTLKATEINTQADEVKMPTIVFKKIEN